MPSKRQILEQLKREDLLAILDEHELTVPDRRVRDDLVDALTAARRIDIESVLGEVASAVVAKAA